MLAGNISNPLSPGGQSDWRPRLLCSVLLPLDVAAILPSYAQLWILLFAWLAVLCLHGQYWASNEVAIKKVFCASWHIFCSADRDSGKDKRLTCEAD